LTTSIIYFLVVGHGDQGILNKEDLRINVRIYGKDLVDCGKIGCGFDIAYYKRNKLSRFILCCIT